MRNLWCWASALALAATSVACSSSSGDSGSSGGGQVINMKGGKGLTYDGGTGGNFDVQGYGGDVKVLSSGSVNTDVALAPRLPYLGTNPWVVAADATLSIGATGYPTTLGSHYVRDNGGAVITGIHVNPGVTLTIKPNIDTNATATSAERVNIRLYEGFIIEGTVKIAHRDTTTLGDGLSPNVADTQFWYMGGVYVASGGKIDTTGTDNVSGPGGNGGDVWFAYPDTFYSAGTLTTKGGNGSTDGGAGGFFEVDTNEGYVAVTGPVTTDGGTAANGTGGKGSNIWMDSSYGPCVLRGTFSNVGGAGTLGGGSSDGQDYRSGHGVTVASGTFKSYGGDATATNGYGGYGGYFYVYSHGPARVAGTIDTHGGKGLGTGSGGTGGYVDVEAYPNYAWGSGTEPDSAGIYFGATVNANGGEGESGGSGGYFYAYNDASYYSTPALAAPIQLVGISSVDGSGGDGQRNGGHGGGYNSLESWATYDSNYQYFSGSVVNEAAFKLKGGNGATGYGGDAYRFYLETESYIYAPYNYTLKNSGAIDLSGGDGATNGGYPGYAYLFGQFGLTNSGAITSNGGKGGSAYGQSGNEIDLDSGGPLSSSGALTSNGGNAAAGYAGDGGSVYVYTSDQASVSGAITATGGSSTSGDAGWGGYVWLWSQKSASSVGVTPNVAKGTGTGTATNGDVWIDGTHVAGP